jgi:hypothetical protein
MTVSDSAEEQLEFILKEVDEAPSKYPSFIPAGVTTYLIAGLRSAIRRIGGEGSTYDVEADRAIADPRKDEFKVETIAGVAQALYNDLRSGYLRTLREIHHAEVFSDYLAMASHLLEEGYKDAAGVIGGSSLEVHLRALASARSIVLVLPNGTPKKAETINADLRAAGAYGKLDQKNVTAWLDLRNQAAHGCYTLYTAEQVRIMLAGISELVARVPA